MRTLLALTERNTKIFFKDKGTFLSAMISPLILIVLYICFLGNIFSTSFESALPEGLNIDKSYISAYVGGWELSSILAVCCVTVALVANTVIVDDKVNGPIKDITIAPVKNSIVALSYYISTALITFIVCITAMLLGFVYLAVIGWHLTALDVFLLLLDTLIMCLFGTAVSSLLCHFITSQGGVAAVSVIVSSVYGFICGAYYPISQFSKGMQNVAVCLPGTYGTSLFRQHYLNNVMAELQTKYGFPDEAIEGMKDAFDINLYFFGDKVSVSAMYAVICGATLLMIAVFILLNYLNIKRQRNTLLPKKGK